MSRNYQERVFSGILITIVGFVGIALLGVFIYSKIVPNVFEETGAEWYFLGIGVFLLLAAANFAFLNIRISLNGVTVSYGLISRNIPINNVAGFYQDETSNIAYGGYGIRVGWVHGKRRLVYNVIGTPRIVIQQRLQPDHEFVFSTRHPDLVMRTLSEVTGIQK